MLDWGRVAISTRLFEGPQPEFVNALAELLARGTRPGDEWVRASVRKAAHHGANEVVRAFLATSCDSLLTLDNDHEFEPDTLDRLRDDPHGFDYHILGALYVSRGARMPIVYRLVPGTDEDFPEFVPASDWHFGDIVPVDQIGLGCTLWRRTVFETLRDPWFRYTAPEEPDETTEDILVCRDARRAGYRIGVHTGVRIGHLATGRLSVTPKAGQQ